MELTSSTVERKASQAHNAVDAAAAKATEKAAPAIDRVARAAHDTVDKVAQAAVRQPIGSTRAPRNCDGNKSSWWTAPAAISASAPWWR